jgi:hypothetical protein
MGWKKGLELRSSRGAAIEMEIFSPRNPYP